MARTRLFRNDGEQMFADDPAQLDYIDPGIVLLYADTGEKIVCSYLEGHLGQPIQATVEHQFDGSMDLSAVPDLLTGEGARNLQLSRAPENDLLNPRWALDGLTADPLPIGELQLDIVRHLVTTGRTSNEEDGILHQFVPRQATGSIVDHSEPGHIDGEKTTGEQLDFAVGHVYDGARFFRFLVQELSDEDVTVAVSKSGRINELADTDIVIHVDGSHLELDERFQPIKGTQELVDAEKGQRRSQRISDGLTEPLKNVDETFGQYTNGDSDGTAEQILRTELNETLLDDTDLEVVPRRQRWYRMGIVTMIGGLLGGYVGVTVSDSVVRLWGYLSRVSAEFIPTAVRYTRVASAALSVDVGFQKHVVALVSLGILVGALVLQRRRMNTPRDDLTPRGVRHDVVSLSLYVTAVVSLIVLVTSVILLWTGW